MGCPHCMSACTKQGEDFDKDNIMEFVNFFKVMGFKALTISGGEPTEHPDFLDIVNTLVWKCVPVATTIVSNGSFLEDERKTNNLIHLIKDVKRTNVNLNLDRKLVVQITSIKGLYKNYDFITSHREAIENMFPANTIFFETDGIRQMRPLGRALRSPKAMEEVRKTHKGFTSCTNTYLISQQTAKMKDFARNCEKAFRFCMPLVGPNLDVHMSESMLCPSVGNLLEHTPVEIFKRMKAFVPCGKCLNDCDNYFK